MNLKLIVFFLISWYALLFSRSTFCQPLEIIVALGFGDCTAPSCLFMHEEIEDFALNHQLSVKYISEDLPSFLKDELMYSHFGHTDTALVQILTDQSTYKLISQGPKTYVGIKNGDGEIIFSGDFAACMERVQKLFQNEGNISDKLSETFAINIDTLLKAKKSLPSLIHNTVLDVSDSSAYVFDGYNSQLIHVSLTEKMKPNYSILDLSEELSWDFISRKGIDPYIVKNSKISVNSAFFDKDNKEIYALTSLALKLKGGGLRIFLFYGYITFQTMRKPL